jgi:hypothetical protein
VTRIVVFAKEPVAGRVKTRLIPALGAEGAARLARHLLERTLDQALATGMPVELCGEPDAAGWHPPRAGLELTAQEQGDLGTRLAAAAARNLECDSVLLIGADCPELDRYRLGAAADALLNHDSILHPAADGGYVLLGLRMFNPLLFEEIPWSTAAVTDATVDRIRRLGCTLHMGETLRDVDEPEDLGLVGLPC